MILRCLILVHKNITQLERLISQLNHPDIYIFIHIDRKMIISDNEIKRLINIHDRIYLLPTRFSNYLDCFSLVETTIELIKFARSIQPTGGYYMLMSGQDYCIKPVRNLINYLSDNYPKPFIDCTPYDLTNWIYYKFRKTIFQHKLFQYRIQSPSALNILIRIFAKALDILTPESFSIYNKIKDFHIPLYGGSAWWVLPDITINEIIDLLPIYKDFVNLYKYSFTPEETFFQTFTMLTSQSALVPVNPIDQVSQNCLTYANFSPLGKASVGHPFILQESDLVWLLERKEFVARKFDMTIDHVIMDKIDSILDNEISTIG